MKTIDYGQFEETYKPIMNPFVRDSSYNGCMFETYGIELAHVREQDNKNIWTIINGENETQWLIPGYSIVDRIGYLICDTPWESEDIQVNDNDMCTIEEAIKYCIDFGENTFNMGFDKIDVTQHFNENLDSTFNGEMTIGKAKYTAMDYYEDRLNKESDEFDDEIHNYYSQLMKINE